MATQMRSLVTRLAPSRFARAAMRPGRAPLLAHQTVAPAHFHGSAATRILNPLPQKVDGDVNTPTPMLETSPVHGSYHWSFERIVAVTLVPLTIAPFAGGALSPMLDAIMASLFVIHSYQGLQSVVIDYVPKYRMPRAHKWFMNALRAGTLLVALGLYEFETNDIGLTGAIHRVWTA